VAKKNLKASLSRNDRIALIEKINRQLPLIKQAKLLSINRTSLYYKKCDIPETVIRIRRHTDEIHTCFSTYGSRSIRDLLKGLGIFINRKTVQRHMQAMGIYAIYPGPNLSKRNQRQRVCPYLLRHLDINHNDQVWEINVTYIRLHGGWVYLTALIDVHSRFIVDWELSTTLDSRFILMMLNRAFITRKPEILNSAQGCQVLFRRTKSANAIISLEKNRNMPLLDFYNEYPPTIKFVDQSTLEGNLLVSIRASVVALDKNNIIK
jgi:putative transposase